MSKRFIVTTNPTTVEQDNLLREWLNTCGFGWWHWINETWLLVDVTGSWTTERIVNKLVELFPGTYSLVIEVPLNNVTWYGYGPNEGPPSDKNMFTWLRSEWGKYR